MALPNYLFHYYEINNGPFRNITEFGPEKAASIQTDITEGFISNRTPDYIDQRFDLEVWLKEQFVNKGGTPNRNEPFYFTLGPCEWLKTWYKNPGVIKIPLADFNPKHLSFTYPDSMISFQLNTLPDFAAYRKPHNGQVFLLEEIKELINDYGLPTEEQWQSIETMKYDRYVEVQVWDDVVVNSFK